MDLLRRELRVRPGRRPSPVACLLMIVLVPLMGAAPPEVVRIRVPSDQVDAWFPRGSEVRGMTLRDFEQLVDAARGGLARQDGASVPRLLRARHTARWESGSLVGHSDFAFDAAGSRLAFLPLVPWTPAVRTSPEGTCAIRSLSDGRTALRVGVPGQGTHAVDWELRARPGTDGRVFVLGLPRPEVTSLRLDLPAELVPEGPGGIRQGPMPGPDPSRRSWQFDGAGGEIDLRLRSTPKGEASPAERRLWVGGSTWVELDEASAQWRAEWDVDPGPGDDRRLSVQLDPDIELVEVTGPNVVGFQAEAAGPGTRLSVRLADEVEGTTRVVLRAVVKVPAEGRWMIPAARPLNAHWTGGRTIVRLGRARVLEDYAERAGRRVVPQAQEMSDPPPLVFEDGIPESVAELTFRRPPIEVSCKVRGIVQIGEHPSRFEAQSIWRVQRGRLPELSVDLAPGWLPDRVQISGADEPTSWRVEDRPRGGCRVRARLPAALEPGSALTLIVSGIASNTPTVGELTLPRVRPISAQAVDELWIAHAERGWKLRPTRAKGLAWVDPMQVLNDAAGPFASFPDPRGGLAWRWSAADGEAAVDRDRDAVPTRGDILTLARVSDGRLSCDWLVTLSPSPQASRPILLVSSEAMEEKMEWRLDGDETGPPLPIHSLDPFQRLEAGIPAGASAWILDVGHAQADTLRLRCRFERPWSGKGRIPLLWLKGPTFSAGTLAVLVERATQSSVVASGLRILDPDAAWKSITAGTPPTSDNQPPPSLVSSRRAYTFGYDETGGRLELRTEPLGIGPSGGVIQEAILTTFASTTGPCRHRLVLQVAPTRSGTLDVTLPRGATLARVRRDGQSILGIRNGQSVSLPLPAPARPIVSMTLDYLGPPLSPGLRDSSPDRPTFSFPCLAFCWEVSLPDPWSVAAAGASLIEAGPPGEWEGEPLLASIKQGPGLRKSRQAATATQVGQDFDAIVRSFAAEEISLADWFTRCDAGRWPVVIDRQALASAGWGPRSRLHPARPERSQPGSALALLRSLGLTLIPLDGVVLITTLAERVDLEATSSERADWRRGIRAAAGTGSEKSDRYQSVTRWLGEATPEAASSSGDSTEATGPSPQRFATSGWPSGGVTIRIVNTVSRSAWALVVGLALFIIGMATRRLSPRTRGAGVCLLLIAAGAASAWGVVNPSPLATGAVLGSLGILAIWLGQSLRPGEDGRRLRGRADGTTTATHPGGIGPAVAIVLAFLALTAGALADAADPVRPIVAILPFEGIPDLNDQDARVLLLLKDHDRLRAWAQAGQDDRAIGLNAASAEHRILRRGERDVIVESRLELWSEGERAETWTIPVGDSFDLAATLDDRPVPLLIQPGGKTATVTCADSGRHVLGIRRVVALARRETGESLSLPINAVASARVLLEPAPDDRRLELPSALGRLEAPDGGIEGHLGSAALLDVRWVATAKSARPTSQASVEGVVLWDAGPAGDRIRASLTYRNPEGTPLIRLGLEPGLLVRSAEVPGLIEATWQGTADRPEWVAHVEPPLADGESISLDLWRPQKPAPAEDGGLPDGPAGAERERPTPLARMTSRGLPRIEPLEVGRYSGSLGFRRPSDWTGSLSPLAGTDPITEDVFLKSWGEFPDGAGVLAGVTRFLRSPAMGVTTGPATLRASVRQSVQLVIQAGRLDVQVAAELSERSGLTDAATVKVPADWQLVTVDGEGLTSWSRPAPDRLRLLFDRRAVPRRRIQLQGWLPVPTEPLASAQLRRQAEVPWPAWQNIEEEPGTLTITAATASVSPRQPPALNPRSIVLETGPGVVPNAGSEPGDLKTATSPARLAYRVAKPSDLGRLVWTAEPPRVNVSVRSLLTLHPASVEWKASVHYQVSGGSSEALFLKLPADWAASARVESLGMAHQLTSRTDGETTSWTLRPGQPVWGTCEVIVRSSRPFGRDDTLSFPDLVPLGRGTAETYLAIADESGLKIELEGSPGLQPMDAGRLAAESLVMPFKGITGAYRVLKEGWTLRVRAAGGSNPPGDDGDVTRVHLADLTCVLSPDGSALGQAKYTVEPGSGPFLGVLMGAGAEVLSATVDEHPVQPLRARSGSWQIPLGDGAAGRVAMVWKADATPPLSDKARSVSLPALEQTRVPTLVSVYAPERFEITTLGGLVRGVRAAAIETIRAEEMSRQLVKRLDSVDRGSTPDRREVTAALARFELQMRTAERALWWARTEPSSVVGGVDAFPTPERLSKARADVVDAVGSGGLDTWLHAAQASVGSLPMPEGEDPATPGPSFGLRLRRLGVASYFQGDTVGKGRAPMIRWSVRPIARTWQRAEVWLSTLLAAVIATLVYRIVARGIRPWPMAVAVVLVTVWALASGLLQPLSAIGALAMIVFGRFSGP